MAKPIKTDDIEHKPRSSGSALIYFVMWIYANCCYWIGHFISRVVLHYLPITSRIAYPIYNWLMFQYFNLERPSNEL